uniref:Uncharacterized protein LOC104243646 n=1 Tax=Nicotiana sylvestris TaxID=4096 RepID=A0A1U7Y5D3_NICSY|nr:PREDICTED: uncharacterized protein LOC104243646 [Nicotiana sylvestris]
MKAQALADHLVKNPVDDEYQPLSTYFPDKEVNSVEVTLEDTKGWKMFFDGAVNPKVSTSVGATPYLLVYGTEVVIPTEVEIPSLRIIVEAEIEDSEWIKTRLEQLTLINEKQMVAVCHGQLYQQRMDHACNKKVLPKNFEVGKLLPKGALYLEDIEGNDPETAVNADAVKRYYV